ARISWARCRGVCCRGGFGGGCGGGPLLAPEIHNAGRRELALPVRVTNHGFGEGAGGIAAADPGCRLEKPCGLRGGAASRRLRCVRVDQRYAQRTPSLV